MHQINADTRAVSELYVMGVCVVALIVYLHVQYLYAMCVTIPGSNPASARSHAYSADTLRALIRHNLMVMCLSPATKYMTMKAFIETQFNTL